jgi:hypothetical protein
MYQKIIQFIKYHNAFTIGFMIVFIGFSVSLAVSPEMRENFVSSQEVVHSIDNSYILAADLDNFNFGLQITAITEDADNYYVTYTYKTIAIQDYVWQEVAREKTLTFSRAVLGGKDLGLHVAEELSELINFELSFLKEVQQSEREKGLTQKIIATHYSGLIGRFLEPEEKVFPGYTPVVQEIVLPIVQEELVIEEIINQKVQELIPEPTLTTPTEKLPEESAPTFEQVPEPVAPEPTPELAPAPEPAPEQAPESAPEPAPEPAPEQVPAQAPAPDELAPAIEQAATTDN